MLITAGALCTVATSYFRAVEMVVNVVFSLVPRPATTVMMATEIPAAINPYSIAVAPDSSARKFLNMFMAHPFWIRSHNYVLSKLQFA